jgi:WD40 repeat protein/serine/threonine protein kinase
MDPHPEDKEKSQSSVDDKSATIGLETATAGKSSTAPPRTGPKIPGYEIISMLGRGGMGIVYKAMQVQLKRLVALKMVLPGDATTASHIIRFRREAEAVAKLQHPHIVQIYDIGEADGYPFFSMEYMEGGSLSKYLSARPQPPRNAAQLVQILADAMHYAHQNGIVHRDLKPGNVLLTHSPGSLSSHSSIGKPEAHVVRVEVQSADTAIKSEALDLSLWTPKISDFGLAKHMGDESGQTHTGDILGTPSFMAPEQTPGGHKLVGPVTDVHALGGILYGALTGRPPYKGATMLDTLEQVRNIEPVPPSRLQPKVPLDLETICLKCLQKDPSKRYGSAQELAEDLGRFLAGEPIRARPVGPMARTWRWCRRNPRLAVWIGLAAFFLLAGSGFSIYFGLQAGNKAREAEASLKRVEAEKRLSDRRSYGFDMQRIHEALKGGHIQVVKQRLRRQTNQPMGSHFEWFYLERLCHTDLETLDHGGQVFAIAFSPDGKFLASAGIGPDIKIWDVASGNIIARLPEKTPRVSSIAFSPDGKWLTAANFSNEIELWDVGTWKLKGKLPGHASRVNSISYSPDGKRLASAGADPKAQIWDSSTGRVLELPGHEGFVRAIAFNPAGDRVATTCYDGKLRIFDAQTGKLLEALTLAARPHGLAFSPDGGSLAVGLQNHSVKVWDTQNWKERLTLWGHRDYVRTVAFSPDSKRIVSAGQDNQINVWDGATGEPLLTLRGHDHCVEAVAFHPDGRRIASASVDKTIKLWDWQASEEQLILRGHTEGSRTQTFDKRIVRRVAFSPNGAWLASAGENCTIRLSSADSGLLKHILNDHADTIEGLAFSSDSAWLASCSDDATIKIWDARTPGGPPLRTLRGHPGPVKSVAFSPDDRRLASAGQDAVCIWKADSAGPPEQTLRHKDVLTVCFIGDGRHLASAGMDGDIQIWDVESGARLKPLPDQQKLGTIASALCDDRIAFVGADNTIKIRSLSKLDEVVVLYGHTCNVGSVEFCKDGERLISTSCCGDDHSIRIWDTATGQEVMTLPCDSAVHAVFSPDSRQLACACGDGTVRVWDARPINAEIRAQRHARSLVDFHSARSMSEAQLLGRIDADAAVSEAARTNARKLAHPSWSARMDYQAGALLAKLFAVPLFREEAIEKLKGDPGISDEVRDRAVTLATTRPENPEAFENDCQLTVHSPGLKPARYQRALREAETLCRLRPNRAESWLLLGIAQYRVGDYAKAAQTLEHPRQSEQEMEKFNGARQLAFLAMAQHHLGKREEAQGNFARLADLMQGPFPGGQEVIAEGFYREAQSLLAEKPRQPAP